MWAFSGMVIYLFAFGSDACQSRFVINASFYTLGGQNHLISGSQDISAPLIENFPSGPSYNKAFLGALYFNSNSSSPCPTNLSAWAAQLSANGLTTSISDSAAPIRISPTTIMGITASQPQNFIGYEVNLTSTSLVASAGTGSISMSGVVALFMGHLYSQSFLTGTRLDDVSQSTNGTFTASGTMTYQSGVLTIVFNSFSLNFNTVGSLNLQGSTFQTIAAPVFAGNMTLVGNQNCAQYCGTYGQCLLQNSSYVCVCDCGWVSDLTLGICSVSTTVCPTTLLGDSSVNSTFNGSSTSCGGAYVTSSPPDEGSANIYRPIISFIPTLWLICLLLVFFSAMRKYDEWIEASESYRVSVSPSGSFHSDQAAPTLALEFEFAGVSAGSKPILHSMSGFAKSGEVVGILGPSGSGKSTLLNILSGEIGDRVGSWRMAGTIKLGGKTLSHAELAKTCAYVPQQLQLPLQMTVEETLCYAAAVRLGASCSVSDARERVQQTLDELGISHVRHSYTGGLSELSGVRSLSWFGSKASSISGGERLRVAIGMEIITDNKLVLLDEPTSGLDAYNALNLMQLLESVARGGEEGSRNRHTSRIIIVSLHQPSSSLFSTLDQVMLLAQGQLVYYGSPAEAPRVFDSLGLPSPSDLSIAEHMLMVTGNPLTLNILLSKSNAESLSTAVISSAKSSDAETGSGGVRPNQDQEEPRAVGNEERLTLSQQLRLWQRRAGVLFWRSSIALFRNPSLILLHIVGAILLGLLVGFVFYQITVETTAGTTGRLGTLFFSVNIVALTSLSAIELVIIDRPVAERDLLRSYYSAFTYMNIKLCLDGFFLRVIPSCIYGTLFYWLAGMRANASAFAVFLGVLSSFNALISGLVVLLTILLGSSGKTLIAATTIILIGTLFAGFLAPEGNMTWALRWICYVSPFRWAWEALVVNEVRPLSLTLAVADTPPLTNYPGGLFLSTLSIDPTMLTTNIIVLVCEYFLVHFLCIIALHARIAFRLDKP